MMLKMIDERARELDSMLAHPKTDYKPQSGSSHFILNAVSHFLADPKSDEVLWFLFKKYILDRIE